VAVSSFVAVARPVLMLIFLVAGMSKLRHLAGLRQTYAGLGVPRRLQASAMIGLPLAELATAGLLAWPATAIPGAMLATLLALAFLASASFALATRRTVPCSCFGKLGRGELGRETVVRDLALLAAAGATTAAFLADSTLRRWTDPVPRSHLSVAAWLAVCFAGTTMLVSAYAGWMITALVRQNARLLRRLAGRDPHSRADATDPVPIGSPAPALGGIAADPREVPDAHQAAPAVLAGLTTLLIFVDEACEACADVARDIAAWQADLAAVEGAARSAQILVVARTAPPGRRDAPFALMSALRDVDGRAASRYGVTATPVALIVDDRERVASRKAFGPDEIRHLYLHFQEGVIRRAVVEMEPARGLDILR
jgi:hypothetical protein